MTLKFSRLLLVTVFLVGTIAISQAFPPAFAIGGKVDVISCGPTFGGTWNGVDTCTITNGISLNIDFPHHHLLVKSGGGVLIKTWGAIN